MGTKLSNINLYNPYGAEYVLEKGFCSKNIVEGWDTILNDGEGYDFLGMLKQAKKLSKELGTTAVYTNYFDDSELVFEIYINGSRKAYYQTDGGTRSGDGRSESIPYDSLEEAINDIGGNDNSQSIIITGVKDDRLIGDFEKRDESEGVPC